MVRTERPSEKVSTLFRQRGQQWPREGQEPAWGHEVLGRPRPGSRGAGMGSPLPMCVLYLQDITYLRIPVADTPEVPM